MTLMLDRQAKSATAIPVSSSELPPRLEEIGLSDILAFLRRQRMPMALCIGAFLLLGVAYLLVTPPLYTATASLLIDTRKLQIFRRGDVFQEDPFTNSAVETQVGILTSGRIVETVVNTLNLSQNREFMNSNWTPLGQIKGWTSGLIASMFFAPPAPVEPESSQGSEGKASLPDRPTLRAMEILLSNLVVERLGLSYIITISYTSTDPRMAARIANELTSAYFEDQAIAQGAAAERASKWLEARIKALREQTEAQDLTAQERSAIRTTYDNFVQRYTETVQQRSLPFTEARSITTAVPPRGRTSPNILLVIAGSLVVGSALGFGVALARDLLDRALRTTTQLESVTGVACLGLLPAFKLGPATQQLSSRAKRKLIDPSARKFAAGPAYSVVLNAPLSTFAETLRCIKVAADTAPLGPVQVLGVISSVPNEGKTTVAVNLARLMAQGGGRVLLIDGHFRDPLLSRDLVTPEAPGLAQAVLGDAKLAEIIWSDQATSLQFLPAGADPRFSGNGLLTTKGTQAMIQACRSCYDTIVFDLPAVLPLVDVRAAAHLFDGFVFVVEWGGTSEDVLAQAFRMGVVKERVIGTVFSKVKMSALNRFEDRSASIPVNNYLES